MNKEENTRYIVINKEYIGCTFDNDNFEASGFVNVVFVECTFNMTNLNTSLFDDCIFQSCIFEGTTFESTRLVETSFIKCNFSEIDFTNSYIDGKFEDCTLHYNVFRRCKINGLIINECNFTRTVFVNNDVKKMIILSSDLATVNFDNQDLENVDFAYCQADGERTISARLGVYDVLSWDNQIAIGCQSMSKEEWYTSGEAKKAIRKNLEWKDTWEGIVLLMHTKSMQIYDRYKSKKVQYPSTLENTENWFYYNKKKDRFSHQVTDSPILAKMADRKDMINSPYIAEDQYKRYASYDYNFIGNIRIMIKLYSTISPEIVVDWADVLDFETRVRRYRSLTNTSNEKIMDRNEIKEKLEMIEADFLRNGIK